MGEKSRMHKHAYMWAVQMLEVSSCLTFFYFAFLVQLLVLFLLFLPRFPCSFRFFMRCDDLVVSFLPPWCFVVFEFVGCC